MHLNRRIITIVLIISAIFDLAFSSSNITLLVALRPLWVGFLVCILCGNAKYTAFLFMILSVFVELINYQPVGVVMASLWGGYLLAATINKVVNLVSPHGFIFSLLVLYIAIPVEDVMLLLFSPERAFTLPIGYLANGVYLTIIYLFAKNILSGHAFSWKSR